jgi:hypothetical protein
MGWTTKQFEDLCEKVGVKPEDALKTGKLDLSPEHQASNSLAQSRNAKKKHSEIRRIKKGYATKLAAGTGVCSKKPKPNSPLALVQAALGADKDTQGNDSRIGIKITAYRLRCLDPDNNTASLKFILDNLQLIGAIPSDGYDAIRLESDQSKVASKKQEKTVITIDYPDP